MPGKEDSLGWKVPRMACRKTNFSWNNRWNKREAEEYRYTQA